MKKILSIILIISICFSLVACENDIDSNKCSNCSAKVLSDDLFCSKCGSTLNNGDFITSTETFSNTSDIAKEDTFSSNTSTSDTTTQITSNPSTSTTSPGINSALQDSVNKDEFNKNIKIYGTYIYVDSADGVSVYLTWENKSEKEIKYMYFRVELYNRVNDILRCNITGKTSINLKQTGPIPKGKGMYHCSGVSLGEPNNRYFIPSTVTYDEYHSDKDHDWAGQYWDNVWYNSTAYYIKITGIQIDYMDGTRYSVLDEKFFDSLDIVNLTINDSIYDY